MSRLPIPENLSEEDRKEESLAINGIAQHGEVNLNIEMISRETENDQFLRTLKYFIRKGWPAGTVPKEYIVYFGMNENLSVEQECIVYGERIIIPNGLHRDVKQLLRFPCIHTDRKNYNNLTKS